jgi:molybdate transport system substrate-binding protein
VFAPPSSFLIEFCAGGIMSSCNHRAPVIGRTLAVTAFLSMALSVAMPTAEAAELQVPVSVALRGAVAQIAAAFEKRSSHTIKMTVAAPGEIVAALQAGQHADVVVLTNGALAELEDKGLVRRGRAPLATTGFGLATRSGDVAPDISTPEALRAALLGASKVIYNDPKVTPSGQLLLHIAARLGVAEQVKAKSQVVAAGTNVSTLAKDTSPGMVVALSVLVEIAGHKGAKLVGPLPKELQVPLPYSAVLGARPVNEQAAQAFLQALAGTDAKQAYAAAGFEVE